MVVGVGSSGSGNGNGSGGNGEEMTTSLLLGVQVHCIVSVKQSMCSVCQY